MTRRISFLLFSMLFATSTIIAQEVTDELTRDVDQNDSLKMGESKYSVLPQDTWELGIHMGQYLIEGDVDRLIPAGFGFGLHLRKAIHNAFSIRADLFYGVAKGLESQPWGSGLVEEAYAPYANYNGGYFPSHRTRQFYGAFQGIINISNLLSQQPRNKWNLYMAVGVGLNSNKTKMDLLDANGNRYDDLISRVGWTKEKFSTKSGRDDIRSALKDIYDGEYETVGPTKAGVFGGDANIHLMFTGSLGVSRNINKRISLCLEHQVMASGNDYLDGIAYRRAAELSANADWEHYTNLRLAINIGNMEEIAEPSE